jgi:hypothetical protein
MFVTRRRGDGLIRVTYWRSDGGGVALRAVSQPGKRRMLISAIDFRAIPATACAGGRVRRAA